MKSMFKVIISNINDKWKEDNSLIKECSNNHFDVIINADKTYQTMQGFGGAFTDATVENYLLLDEKTKEKFINAYFTKEGLNYSLGRYPIHSTDFSSYSYDYLKDNSHDINDIDINKDRQKIDLVRRCEKVACNLDLMMSVWSPFKWMKDNNSLYQGGHLKLEHFDDWASYLAKVAKILKDNDINIKMITSQNEPQAVQTWESCIYSGEDEGRFLNLLHKHLVENNSNDINIYLVDHNRDLLPDRVMEIMKYCTAPVYGVAYHWYDHSCFENLEKTHDVYANFHLLMSECCVELLVDRNPIGSIEHAERYAFEMINDFNNYSEGYIDWNLLLNEQGGPNHVGNYCESPIMVDRKTRQMMILPTYYYIGHFSKHVNVGAKRLDIKNDTKTQVCAFKNPDGRLAIIVLNNYDEKQTITLKVMNDNVQLTIPMHSIITLVQ